jgi:hypothetical protein
MGGDRAQVGGRPGELPARGPDGEQPPAEVDIGHLDRAQRARGEFGSDRERAEHRRADAGRHGRLDRGGGRQFRHRRHPAEAGLRAQRLLEVAAGARARFPGDQRRRRQFGGGDAGPPPLPPVARRHHDREPVRAHLPRRQAGRQVRSLYETEFRAAVEHRRRRVRRIARGQVDGRPRVAGAQRGQPAGQQVFGDRHRRRHPQHRVAAGAQRRHARVDRPGDIFRDLGPNWFASVMGTGIVAVAAGTLPFRVPGLHMFALAVWALAAALLAALTAAWAVHWTKHTARARGHADNPVMAQFWGAPAMALMTVGAGTLLVGRDVTGLAAAVDADWALWGLGTALGLVTACWIPYLMMTRHEIAPDAAFGGWLMPVVPPMVSAANGALLVPHAAAGQARLTLVLGCYGMFGISLFASVIIITLLWGRLIRLDTARQRPGPAVPVGRVSRLAGAAAA